MTWVKVCGLTRPEHVAAAVEAGADAVGFVIALRSVRRVSIERAAGLMEGVPILRVLVSADALPEELIAAARETGADGVQPHGLHAEHAAAAAEGEGLFVLRPLSVTAGTIEPDPTAVPEAQIPLLDTAHAELHGASGVAFAWGAIDPPARRFVLAGGLDPENVADAISALRPWGVDASSRLEQAPGIKDTAKVAAFVREAKRA
jgi:phosphoribosylanthranilate isomerase